MYLSILNHFDKMLSQTVLFSSIHSRGISVILNLVVSQARLYSFLSAHFCMHWSGVSLDVMQKCLK